jgi:hypothetical protein
MEPFFHLPHEGAPVEGLATVPRIIHLGFLPGFCEVLTWILNKILSENVHIQISLCLKKVPNNYNNIICMKPPSCQNVADIYVPPGRIYLQLYMSKPEGI